VSRRSTSPPNARSPSLGEAADDLRRICNDPDEARRYFALVDKAEIEENEFNLNLPRLCGYL